MVLLNPRHDDASAFLRPDLQNTFWFWPLGVKGSREYERASYTIDVLKLNERSDLLVARKEAYDSYRARLVEYIKLRGGGVQQNRLDRYKAALQNMQHPTVWAEMKRQYLLIPELKELFAQVPEALNW